MLLVVENKVVILQKMTALKLECNIFISEICELKLNKCEILIKPVFYTILHFANQ